MGLLFAVDAAGRLLATGGSSSDMKSDSDSLADEFQLLRLERYRGLADCKQNAT